MKIDNKNDTCVGASISDLPDEVLCCITQYLNVKSLVACREINHRFNEVASLCDAGWKQHCAILWQDKVISNFQRARNESFQSSMMAFKTSLQDVKVRNFVFREEVIFDPQTGKGQIWNFRFKETAGPEWTSWDPWHNGDLAREMVLFADGTVMQFVREPLLREQEEIHRQIQERQQQGHNQNGAAPHRVAVILPHQQCVARFPGFGCVFEPPVPMKWRFCFQPMDLPERPLGSYFRFTVGGREVPTYICRRSPSGNWGFLMESCWGCYANFTLPKRQVMTGRQNQRQQQQRQMQNLLLRRDPSGNGGRWIRIDDDDDDEDEDMDDEDETTNPPTSSAVLDLATPAGDPSVLADDSSFIMSNEVQWREALLYNFGASALPEGEAAIQEFERLVGHHLHAHGVQQAILQQAQEAVFVIRDNDFQGEGADEEFEGDDVDDM